MTLELGEMFIELGVDHNVQSFIRFPWDKAALWDYILQMDCQIGVWVLCEFSLNKNMVCKVLSPMIAQCIPASFCFDFWM